METSGKGPTIEDKYEELKQRVQCLEQELAERTVELETREQELALKTKQLEAITRIGYGIASSLDIERLLNQLAKDLRDTFDYDHVHIYLLEGNELSLKALADRSEDKASLLAKRLKLDEGLPGWVARTGEPLLASDVSREPRYLPIEGLEEVQAELAVPLLSGGEVMGVLDVRSDCLAGVSEEDLILLHPLAPQISASIEKARLFQWTNEAKGKIELLYDISRHLSSSLDVDEVLAKILSLTIPNVGASKGSVMILDHEGKVSHRILIREDLPPQEAERVIKRVLAEGLAGWVIEHKKGTIVSDTSQDERWLTLPGQEDIGSAIAVPLLRGDKVIGVLDLVHPQSGYFHEGHLTLLTSVANLAAAAIENASLLSQMRQRVRELSILNEISHACSFLDLDKVLTLITERMARAFRVDRCALFLLDEEREELILRAADNVGRSTEGAIGLRLPLSARPHVADAIACGEPVEIRDIFSDPRLEDFWPLAREMGLEAYLAVPILVKGRAIGAISLDRTQVRPPFLPEEVALCRTLANQAAIAIENARLYEETRHRAEQLRLANEVGHYIGVILDIDWLLWEVVRLIRETFDCYHVSIALIEGDELVFKADVGHYQREFLKGLRLKLGREGEGITCWVANTGRPLLVPDVRQDPHYRFVEELPENRSELAVPLKIGDRVIGVLDVQSSAPGDFEESDLALLQSLAAQVAVTVENARLFGYVREERAKLEAIINGTGDAIIVTDNEERVLLMNPAARWAFTGGLEPEIGRPLREVVTYEELLTFWAGADSEPRSGEIPLPDERTLYASLTPIPGVGRIAVMQDITYLKKLDEMKSDFVSNVSHDLGSPLQIIQSSADLIPLFGELNEEQREALDKITTVVARMSELVRDLLDIGKIAAGVDMEMELCSLTSVTAVAVERLRAKAEAKGLTLTLDLPEDLPLIWGNRDRLDQVVTNLVDNAIKYTLSGTIRVSAREEKGEVIVEVQDTGIGIALEDQGNLFQKFYRVRNAQTEGVEGTGLGLAIVRSIVERHSGRVGVESEPGRGSTFSFALPVASIQLSN